MPTAMRRRPPPHQARMRACLRSADCPASRWRSRGKTGTQPPTQSRSRRRTRGRTPPTARPACGASWSWLASARCWRVVGGQGGSGARALQAACLPHPCMRAHVARASTCLHTCIVPLHTNSARAAAAAAAAEGRGRGGGGAGGTGQGCQGAPPQVSAGALSRRPASRQQQPPRLLAIPPLTRRPAPLSRCR